MSPEDWTRGEDYGGWYEPGLGVEVRGTTPEGKLSILLHELGHGFLEHDDDRHSVMFEAPTATVPSDDDVARARDALGCAL